METKEIVRVINEQKDFILVDKPPGINFHDEDEPGSGLFSQIKNILNLAELYPVHRLDKLTSGLILFAKNKDTAQDFQRLFSEHKVEKYYLAISDKKPKKKQGLVKGDMAKSRRGMWKLLRTQNNPAISQFFSYALGDGKRLFLVKPHSGKTHQIRVALNSLGAPIIGDSTYYPGSNADRGYLHAYAIGFQLNQARYQYILKPDCGDLFVDTGTVNRLKEIPPPWELNWPKV